MTGDRTFRIGFQTSIIVVFVGVVLLVGLALVYLSFERVTAITRAAASGFSEKVASSAPTTSTSTSRISAKIIPQYRTAPSILAFISELIPLASLSEPEQHPAAGLGPNITRNKTAQLKRNGGGNE